MTSAGRALLPHARTIVENAPAVAKKASDAVAEIESDALRDALERLGRGVFGEVERS
mgnify:CR=1 FL=1